MPSTSHPNHNAALDAARQWVARGYYPIPVPYREKSPVIDRWQDLRLVREEDLAGGREGV